MDPKQVVKNIKESLPAVAGVITTAVLDESFSPIFAGLSSIVAEEILDMMKIFKEKEKQNSLSSSEKKRLDFELECIIKEISKNINEKMEIRKDDFFQKRVNDRSSAQELLEGTLYAAIYEYEQKKITYYAHLFANIIYNAKISREDANYLLTLGKEFSYRALCIIAILKNTVIMPKCNSKNIYIFQEIYYLYQNGICYAEGKSSRQAILAYGNLREMRIKLDHTGELLFELMNLSLLLDTKDVNEIKNKLEIS